MKYISVALILLFGHICRAQDHKPVWHKLIIRGIRLGSPEKASKLAIAALDEMQAGKMNAYYTGLQTMTRSDLDQIVTPGVDTIPVLDSNGVKTGVITRERTFHRDSITEYDVLENWTFDPEIGKLKIETIALSPSYKRGPDDIISTDPFWIKQQDVTTLLKRSCLKDWADSFLHNYMMPVFDVVDDTDRMYYDSGFNYTSRTWKNTAKKHFCFDLPRDTITFDPEMHLSSELTNAVKRGQLSAWALKESFGTSNTISPEDIESVISPPDSIDTVYNGEPVTMVIAHDINYADLRCHTLLEDWRYDQNKGEAEMSIKAVSVDHGYVNDSDKLTYWEYQFWVRYIDMQPQLRHLEEYFPETRFAVRILDDLFDFDDGPALEEQR